MNKKILLTALVLGVGYGSLGLGYEEQDLQKLRNSASNSCQNCDLSGLDLSGGAFAGANLSGANLEGAIFSSSGGYNRTRMIGVNLEGANLSNVNFKGAMLREANLKKTNLQNANFEGATLQQANLDGADLKGAKMDRIESLYHASFKNAKNVPATVKKHTNIDWRFEGATFTE